MALSLCSVQTDLHDQELQKHGDPSFPIACYADNLEVDQVPWHWHEEWELIVITEAPVEVFVENHRVPLEVGDGIFINSKALHAISEESTGKLHSAVFHPRLVGGNADSHFWASLVAPFLANVSARYFVLHKSVDWEQDVMIHFTKAWEAIAFEPDDYQNLARYELSAALHRLLKYADFQEASLSTQELTNAHRIRTMLEYIEANYNEELTVEMIANSIASSESVALRCFQQMLHTSPMQYVKEVRLKKAADQLLNSNKSAKEVAMDCGFNDISYFTRAFKKAYGVTPGQYRKASQN